MHIYRLVPICTYINIYIYMCGEKKQTISCLNIDITSLHAGLEPCYLHTEIMITMYIRKH